MYRYLVADAGGMSYYLDNVVMILKEAFTNKGIGPRCVIKEIHAAGLLRDELPIRCIQVDAVGNDNSFFLGKRSATRLLRVAVYGVRCRNSRWGKKQTSKKVSPHTLS